MNLYDFPFGLTKTDQLGLHVASLGALHVGSCDILIMSGECSDLDAEIGVFCLLLVRAWAWMQITVKVTEDYIDVMN